MTLFLTTSTYLAYCLENAPFRWHMEKSWPDTQKPDVLHTTHIFTLLFHNTILDPSSVQHLNTFINPSR